jgi:hypothetical protein
MASFREFLSQGKIGDIRIGMPLETVQKYIGPPEDLSVKKRPIEILKYGSIELAFHHAPDANSSRLIAIAIYFSLPKRMLPPSVVFEDWTPTGDTTEEDFRDFVQSAGMHACSRIDGENRNLVLDSGASIVFVDEHLHSVHFRRADKAPLRRQMSVSLPESTLTQLRARAERENVSLQELIEKVLSTST